MQYRADIDGLRAVAVLPALFFHAGFPGFDGGYVGIEIFFVVSGYLITNIILNEQDRRGFSIIDFYERRARRILPALSLVLLVTTLVAFLLMPAYLLEWYSQSLVAVSSFISNIYFYFTTGYFAPTAGEKPLLHMWSLAVEEQYYLVYPLFMALFLSLSWRKFLPFAVLFLILLSLAFTQTLAMLAEHKANYYHTFSRAWELLIGALIAFWSLDKKYYPFWLRELFCVLGLLMIAFAVVFFDEGTLYPSLFTLIPVLGTCAIIMFGNEQVSVSRFLSLRSVVLVGLMSYSVYLWHHPVYAFMRLKTPGEPGFWSFVFAVLLTLVLGYLSWRYVEKPFRNKQAFSRKQIFSLAAGSVLFFIALGSAGQYFEGFPQRFSQENYSDSIRYSEKRGSCHTRGRDYLKPAQGCEYFGENVRWAVMGDSHSVEIAYQLARRLEPMNVGLKHLSFSDCPPSLYLELETPGCSAWFHEAANYLKQNSRIENVLLSYRHSKFLFGEHRPAYPDVPNIDPNSYLRAADRSESAEEARQRYWSGFRDFVYQLRESGKRVYILMPIPEIPMEFRNAVTPFWVFSEESLMDIKKTVAFSYYKKRQAYILDKMATLDFNERLLAIDPVPVFCDETFCSAVKEGKSLYIDDDHPSLFGAKRIVNLIAL